jgi:uncharacterized protein YjdB
MIRRGLIAALAWSLPGAAAAQNVSEVQVAPPTVTIRVGERSGLLATAFDRIGNVIPTVRIIWSSNNVNVAKVDNNGTVTGVANGVAIIEGRVGARRGQAAVQVTGGAAPPPAPPAGPPAATPPPPPPGPDPFAGQPAGTGPAAALRLEPGVIYLLPSENTRVSPRALREDGSPAAPVMVTWTSLRPDVASVDQSGNVVALSPGQGTIQLTASGAGGLTATAPVVVQQAEFTVREGRGSPLMLSPGEVDTLHVIVASQSNRTVNPLVLQWASSDQSVARISLGGVVTAAGPGRAILTVSGLLQSKTIDVSVHPVVAKLTVLPKLSEEVQVPLTGSTKFEAHALTAENAPVPEAPLRWIVTDPGIASFDPQTGLLTGRAVGKTQLTVRGPGSGLAVAWNISVIAGFPRFVQPRVGIGINQRRTLRANYADDQGNVIGPASNLTWSSDNPQIASVGEDGTVAGVGYGHAKVTAAAPGGKTATADVYVVGEIIVASSRAAPPGKFQLYAVERSNLAQLTKLTPDTTSASDPAFAADGSRLAFVSQRDGNAEIYIMNADGTGSTRITNDPQPDGRPSFTPDGQALVFHSSRTAGKQQIWVVNVDGTGLTQLTRDSVNSSPTVSPDGQTIAYVSTRNKDGDIWLMARDGSNQRQFTRSPQQRESEPRFLRDGTLAYLVERRENNRTVQQVMRADLATGATTALTGTDLAIASFAVSPSGDLVALVVNAEPQNRRNPTYRVYIQPVSSATPIPLPATGTEQMITPTFRP